LLELPGKIRAARASPLSRAIDERVQFLSFDSRSAGKFFMPSARKNRNSAQKIIDAKIFQLYIQYSRKEVRHYGKEESR
jgi:hypothetical protein